MPVWLSRFFGKEDRVVNPRDRERFTRGDFLVIVLCIASMIVLGNDFSLNVLAIVAGCVVVIWCLTYTPVRILVSLGLCAAGAAFVYFADRMKEWHVIVVIALCATVWLQFVVESAGRTILSRVDEAHRKLDSLRERIEEIEAKQDESGSTYINPIDL